MKTVSGGDYDWVPAPNDFPGSRYRERYCAKHHLIYWQNTGKIPGLNEVIHHINGNTRDNRFENLQLKTRSQHSSDHSKPGEQTELVCDWCEKTFIRRAYLHRYRKKIGYKHSYCCKAHQAKHQQTILGNSARKEEIYTLLNKGFSYSQVASELGISKSLITYYKHKDAKKVNNDKGL